MPQKDMSSQIGSSPSKAHQDAINLNKNVQQPQSSTDAALANAYNKHPKKV